MRLSAYTRPVESSAGCRQAEELKEGGTGGREVKRLEYSPLTMDTREKAPPPRTDPSVSTSVLASLASGSVEQWKGILVNKLPVTHA